MRLAAHRPARCASLALLAAAVLVPAAAAGTAAPKKPKPPPAPGPGQTLHRHTDAGTAAARRALITLDALDGWRAKAPGSHTAALTCSSFEPLLTGVVETGAAVSPTFERSTAGPFVAQSAWVYRTPAQAATLWRRVVGGGLLGCFAESVQAGSTTDVTVTVERRSKLGLPRLGVRGAGYRVAATVASAGQTVSAYYDLIVLGHASTVTELTFARFATPMPRARELALARLVARRL